MKSELARVLTAFLGVFLTSTVINAEPLTHEDVPWLSDSELRLQTEAESFVQQASARRSDAVPVLVEILKLQTNTLPAYRTRLHEISRNLLKICVASEPQQFWEIILRDERVDGLQLATIHLIAVHESIFRDYAWTPDGSLAVLGDAENIQTVYTPGNGADALMFSIPKQIGPLREILLNPWSRRDFGYPLLAGIDPETVIVRQAYWDDDHETLLFTLEPVGDEPVLTTIIIENIYTNYLAILLKNGEYRAAIDEHAQVAGEHTRNLDPGQIEVQVRLEGVTRFTLKPME